MMQPIDTYREKGFYGSRSVELYEDRVVVSGYRAFSSDFKVTVPLATLEPTVGQVGLREQTKLIGMVALVGGAVCAVSWTKYPDFLSKPGFWVGGFFSVIGLLILLRSLRRIETAAFFTSAGVHRLSIARMGPDAGRFQDFVERVVTQIGVCRAAGSAG